MCVVGCRYIKYVYNIRHRDRLGEKKKIKNIIKLDRGTSHTGVYTVYIINVYKYIRPGNVRTARARVCHSRCSDQKTLDSSDKVEWESSLEAKSVLRCRARTYLY